jgi:hypothetical protein
VVTIKKGIINKLGFTLNELIICDENMEFLFKFTSENSAQFTYEVIKSPINISQRLQIFEFDEPNDIAFEFEGYYSYEIYQTTSNNLVEVGLLRVEGDSEQMQQLTNAKNPQVYGE